MGAALQEMLKEEKLPEEEEIEEVTLRVWEKMVRHMNTLCLVGEPKKFHLMFDYSSKRCGYALFARAREDGKLMELNFMSH